MWIRIAAIFMFLGVALGAFGSHALKAKLDTYSLDIFKTAVMYHLIHALGIFIVAVLLSQGSNPKLHWAGIFLVAGIILFSGSLYLLAVTGQKWLGAVTPLGGLSFLTAWVLIALAALW